jgi:hypothetical protein
MEYFIIRVLKKYEVMIAQVCGCSHRGWDFVVRYSIMLRSYVSYEVSNEIW